MQYTSYHGISGAWFTYAWPFSPTVYDFAGAKATANGVIGGLVNDVGHNGKYDEIGIFGDFQW